MEASIKKDSVWFNLLPKFDSLCSESQQEEVYKDFIQFCKELEQKKTSSTFLSNFSVVETFRGALLPTYLGKPVSTITIALQLAKNVVLDLVSQGWDLSVNDSMVRVCCPQPNDELPSTIKERVRNWHLIERDSQLREKAVADFIKGMETGRLNPQGWHSIFSVMRDGDELSKKLLSVKETQEEEKRATDLAEIIRPYLQFVEGDAICEHTGLQLRDIWRYFRHTWVNAYKSTPGRSIMILVRDAAAENHPVIGIAALGSSVVQQSIRDKWIGWDSSEFVKSFLQNPTQEKIKWIFDTLNHLISNIYVDDLKKEGIYKDEYIDNPTDEIITKLIRESENAIKEHRLFPRAAFHRSINNEPSNKNSWKEKALTSLFRSKRCGSLANLMSIKKILYENKLNCCEPQKLVQTLNNSKVRTAVGQLIRLVKAEHVGIDMMDITICGAVYPYNLLLGGKLVCMLLCSPEVVGYYSKRYAQQPSIIASSMKGYPVKREPKLVLLCTTSLYGVGSSQYNRIKIPTNPAGGKTKEYLEYKKLGLSEGFGSFHFSQHTVGLINLLLARRKEGRRVNSIFGEGVNPKMRKIREGLDLINLSSDLILRHGNRRVVYAIPLARNFREILVGINKIPEYFIPVADTKGQTTSIADYWRRRWLSKRINSVDLLNKVASHTLDRPVEHGAKVPLEDTELEAECSVG